MIEPTCEPLPESTLAICERDGCNDVAAYACRFMTIPLTTLQETILMLCGRHAKEVAPGLGRESEVNE